MPRVIQAAEFFVVGGPVQPDRLCYVERPADSKCMAALAARKHCHVLGPRAIGKSSLMGRVAKQLRQRGELVAVVDLAQREARGENDDANGWIYGIASKIVHELRLPVDLAAWWQEANALARGHRLADFFWEIVLTNTTAPITVLIDGIEIAVGAPFGRELFGALEECRVRRRAESDFGRLTFVVLGAASLGQLGGRDGAPFAAAEAIELGDFTAEESYRLALGLGGDQIHAQALMDRICVWTNGHPYLTQKVARAVSRTNGRLEDVERVVREQLLTPAALLEEPPLAHARAVLTARTPAARQALKVLRRVARGAKVPPPRDAAVLDVLRLAGAAGVDEAGLLRYRNRIFKEQLGARWLKAAAPARGRASAAAAVLALAAAAGGYWYVHYVPQPYIRALSAPDADPDAANEAYRQLRRLPGFAAQADRLLGDALIRRAGTATTYGAALATDAQLRQLPGQQKRADALLADFWLRKSDEAAHAERRDMALLLALRAAAADAANGAARSRAAELAGSDYRALASTTRSAAPAYWSVDWPRAMLLSIDEERRLVRTPLGAADVDIPPLPFTALRHAVLERELLVTSEGSAGAFELTMAVRHAASAEVQVTLAAPSGAEATFVLPSGSAERAEDYVFSAAEGSPLAALADEGRRGVWRLRVVDRRVDNLGVLFDWGLRFGEEIWSDAPAQPVDIPEPSRTDAVTVEPSGTFAVVRPAEPGGIGTFALWSLVDGRLQDDFTLPDVPRRVELNAPATRMLAVTESSVTLFNAADSTPVARLGTQTEFVLPPVFSVDGGYVAIAERVDGALPLYSLLSSVDGGLLASIEGVADARSWLLGPGARYTALLVSPTLVRVLDPRRGTELARLMHGDDVRRIVPLPDGSTLLTVDARGDIRLWDVAAGRAGVAGGERLLGTTADAASVSVAAGGTRIAYAAATGEVVVRELPSGAPLHALRLPPAMPPTRTQLSPDGAQLVTAADGVFRVWSLAGAASGAAPRADVASIAVDGDADVAAIGFRAGDLVARKAADLDLARAELGYFGHAGSVTSVALNAARGLAASGGADGTVRIWDLASALPSGDPLRHGSRVPVAAVALSADGGAVVSAAGGSARVWKISDGTQIADVPSSGSATVVAFAPGADLVAVGDDTGQVTLAPLAGGAARRTLRVGTRATAIAFAANGTLVATGDADGGVRLWRVADGAPVGQPLRLPRPVRWLGFDAGSGVLLVATDYWLHSVSAAQGLVQLHSRLAPLRLAFAGLAAAGDERVRIAGIDERGTLRSIVMDLAAASTAAPLPERDWPAVLGVVLDESGEILRADF